MTSAALNTFPNVLLIFNICQWLMISLIFRKVGLYGGTYVSQSCISLLKEFISLNCQLFRFGFEWCFRCTLFDKLFNQVIRMLFVFIKSLANRFHS